MLTIQRRSSEATGAVFWMVAYGIVNIVSAIQYTYSFGFTGLAQVGIPVSVIFGLLLFVAAYFALKQKSWAFIISMILGGFNVIATPAVDGFNGPIPAWDVFILLGGFLTLYSGFLGFLKVKFQEH